MNTAVFELVARLAAGAGGGSPMQPSAPTPLVPLQASLPSEAECSAYGSTKPLLFFFDPHTETNAAGTAGGPALPQRATHKGWSARPWPPELTVSAITAAAAAASPALPPAGAAAGGTAALRSLCVTPAEDDAESRLSPFEVWGEWPTAIGGWQLCAMSHVCAALRCGASTAAGGGAGSAKSLPSFFYLVASRYELVGTGAVYERYLFLTPTHSLKHSSDSSSGGSDGALAAHHHIPAMTTTTTTKAAAAAAAEWAGSGAAAVATSISVHELRAMERVACLCRCFWPNGCEVQPGPGAAQSRHDPSAPPPPPADFFLRLVPTSLHYTFCRTTTALLSVVEEERSQAWAATTAELQQQQQVAAAAAASAKMALHRHRSCSTEAANTSGALTDGGHTLYHDSTSFSRERSASTVRLMDGAGVRGLSEDPRSLTPTPARPTAAAGRADASPYSVAAAHESATEQRLPPSQRWCAMSLRRLVADSFYDGQVPAGWRRWRYASSGILCRPLVVDSLDGIVRYIHGSRLAFYTAVAFLDRFIAVTVDPMANFLAYRRQLHRARVGQEMDFSMLTGGAGGGAGRRHQSGRGATSTGGLGSHSNGGNDDDEVQARDICCFLTQVIVVCIMLGSKTVDLYPPRIRQLMGCVEDTAPINEQEFVILELHVLMTLGFPVHPVTLHESVNALLTFTTSDALFGRLTASHTTRRLLEEYQDRGHLVDDIDRLLAEQRERDAAQAVREGRISGARAAAAAAAEPLTTADRRAMNDWLRLRLFAYFVCDEVIRADAVGGSRASSPPSSAASSPSRRPAMDRSNEEGGGAGRGRATEAAGERDGEDNEEEEEDDGSAAVLRHAPVLVAAAALVTAAEQLRMPLPEPILRLVPQALRDRLRVVDAVAAQRSRPRFAANEESNPTPHRGTSSSSPPPLSSFSAARSGVAGAVRLVAQPVDDHYQVLMELSVMMEGELMRVGGGVHSGQRPPHTPLVSPPLEAEEKEDDGERAEEKEEEEGGSGAGGLAGSATPSAALRRTPMSSSPVPRTGQPQRAGLSYSSSPYTPAKDTSAAAETNAAGAAPHLPPADAHAVAAMGRLIGHVRAIHERSRENCPPVLLQRYQPLFRDAL